MRLIKVIINMIILHLACTFFYDHDSQFVLLLFSVGTLVDPLNSYFGSVTGQALFGGVQCLGNETTLLDCSYNTSAQCTNNQQAGVLCPGTCVLRKHY